MEKVASITQLEVIDFVAESLYYNKSAYIDLEVGMGKTLTAGYLLKELIEEDRKRILYICPASLIPQVSKVFETSFPDLRIEFKSYSWFQNLEFVKSQLSYAKQFDLVILDEAHTIKSYSTSILAQAEKDLDYFIDLKKISNKFPYILVSVGTLAFIKNIKYSVWMSGTPMPLGAVDIFNFLWNMKHKRLISNIHSRQESFYDFCNTYCVVKNSPAGKSFSGFKQENYGQLLKLLSDCYIKREHKDEKSLHLKIPEPNYIKLSIPDNEGNHIEEERIIDILRKHYNVTPENFLQILKATPQFAQMMALRRAVGISKIKTVLKHTKKIGKKAIYFFQFKEASQIFFNEMTKKFKNVYHVTSGLSKIKTAKIMQTANSLDECIIVATMGKAGTGFDCPGFSTSVFVELDMNFARVEQASGRILRKGITKTPNIIYCLIEGGIDEMLIKNLKLKKFKRIENLKEGVNAG